MFTKIRIIQIHTDKFSSEHRANIMKQMEKSERRQLLCDTQLTTFTIHLSSKEDNKCYSLCNFSKLSICYQ